MDDFNCPISNEMMKDPVMTPNGDSYDRVNIEEWIRSKGTDPLTREPLALTQLIPNRALKRAIEAAFPPEVPTSPASAEGEASGHVLSKLFALLDKGGLQDIASETLAQLTPPSIVVLGAESHGKSTVLERILGTRLLPQGLGTCTKMVIKVQVRRGPSPDELRLEIFDSKANRTVEVKTVALQSGKDEIRALMERTVLQASGGKINSELELRVHLTSLELPPMNLVDTPGLVATGPRKGETHDLAKKVMEAYRESGTFLIVVKATEAPNLSPAMELIKEMGLAERSIGVLTNCDRLQTMDEFELLRSWLANIPNNGDNGGVELKPNGYVAVMNLKQSTSPIHSGIKTGAQNASKAEEVEWFSRLPGSGSEKKLVGIGALVEKLDAVNLKQTLAWLPLAGCRLHNETQRAMRAIEDLGLPMADGQLQGAALEDLRQKAREAIFALLEPHLAQDKQHLVKNLLLPLRQRLLEALPAKNELPPDEVPCWQQRLLEQCQQTIRSQVEAATKAWADGACSTMLPTQGAFKLGRFPRLHEQVMGLLRGSAPWVEPASINQALEYLSTQALDPKYLDLEYKLEGDNPLCIVGVQRERIVDRVLFMLTRGHHFHSANTIQLCVSGAVEAAFCSGEGQNIESCLEARRDLQRHVECLDRVYGSLREAGGAFAAWRLASAGTAVLFRHITSGLTIVVAKDPQPALLVGQAPRKPELELEPCAWAVTKIARDVKFVKKAKEDSHESWSFKDGSVLPALGNKVFCGWAYRHDTTVIVFRHDASGFIIELPCSSNGWIRARGGNGEGKVIYPHGEMTAQSMSQNAEHVAKQIELGQAMLLPTPRGSVEIGTWKIQCESASIRITNIKQAGFAAMALAVASLTSPFCIALQQHFKSQCLARGLAQALPVPDQPEAPPFDILRLREGEAHPDDQLPGSFPHRLGSWTISSRGGTLAVEVTFENELVLAFTSTGINVQQDLPELKNLRQLANS